MEAEEYHLFEKYLNNDLVESERTAFEKRLSDDKNFAEAFFAYKDITESLSAKETRKPGEQELRATLATISDEFFHLKTKTRSTRIVQMRTLYWAAAASIILILGTVFYFQNISTPETLYAKYAAHDELALTVRGEEDSLKLQAEIHFNNGQFEIAADILGELHQRYLENTDITLYLAIALIESRQHIRARTLLREVQKSGSVFGDKATWYLALSYLKEDKVDECKAVLKDISKESPMYKEATQLLKEL